MGADKNKMNPLCYDLGNALLARQREICSTFEGSWEQVLEDLKQKAIIAYKPLLKVIGAPESLAEGIGQYLYPLAEWCQDRGLPPINSLAVNGTTRVPGVGYYSAPGCGEKWEQEVRECIACKDYPAEIVD